LIDFNEHLQEMVDVKTKTVVELQNAILTTMTKLVDCRDDITGGHIERTEHILELLLEDLSNQKIYHEAIDNWDTKLLLKSAQLHDVGKIKYQRLDSQQTR
jgi:putative two-component system response regulator